MIFAHLEERSLGSPSIRPSTLVSSTRRSALSSLASSRARLSLSWKPARSSWRSAVRAGCEPAGENPFRSVS
jgi:hypothetical protein